MTDSGIPRVPLQRTQGCVLATLPAELAPGLLVQFELDLLAKIRESELRGVVIDLSSLELMDLTDFRKLSRIAKMTEVLGARAILVGLRPGVVAGLVALGASAEGLDTALNVELGLERLVEQRAAQDAAAEVELPIALKRALAGGAG